jgi:hypothetical protein
VIGWHSSSTSSFSEDAYSDSLPDMTELSEHHHRRMTQNIVKSGDWKRRNHADRVQIEATIEYSCAKDLHNFFLILYLDSIYPLSFSGNRDFQSLIKKNTTPMEQGFLEAHERGRRVLSWASEKPCSTGVVFFNKWPQRQRIVKV